MPQGSLLCQGGPHRCTGTMRSWPLLPNWGKSEQPARKFVRRNFFLRIRCGTPLGRRSLPARSPLSRRYPRAYSVRSRAVRQQNMFNLSERVFLSNDRHNQSACLRKGSLLSRRVRRRQILPPRHLRQKPRFEYKRTMLTMSKRKILSIGQNSGRLPGGVHVPSEFVDS